MMKKVVVLGLLNAFINIVILLGIWKVVEGGSLKELFHAGSIGFFFFLITSIIATKTYLFFEKRKEKSSGDSLDR